MRALVGALFLVGCAGIEAEPPPIDETSSAAKAPIQAVDVVQDPANGLGANVQTSLDELAAREPPGAGTGLTFDPTENTLSVDTTVMRYDPGKLHYLMLPARAFIGGDGNFFYAGQYWIMGGLAFLHSVET